MFRAYPRSLSMGFPNGRMLGRRRVSPTRWKPSTHPERLGADCLPRVHSAARTLLHTSLSPSRGLPASSGGQAFSGLRGCRGFMGSSSLWVLARAPASGRELTAGRGWGGGVTGLCWTMTDERIRCLLGNLGPAARGAGAVVLGSGGLPRELFGAQFPP